MANLRWDGDDFRNSQDSSGSTSDLISHSGDLQQGYRHGSLTEGLVAYYPMEKGEGEILHDGALNNTGQINGATWTNAKIGSYALDFNDANNEYVDTGSPITGNHPFTVSAWVKPDVVGVDFKEIAANHTPNNDGWYFRNDSSGWKFSIRDSSGSDVKVTSSTNSTADIWTHLTGVWNGEKIKIYVNGGKEDSTSATSHTPSNSNVYIGASPGYGEYFDGTIEEVRIYNRTLSEPEIQALANISKPSGIEKTESKVPNQDQGGVSRYKFDGDVNDSWSSNNGSNNGATYNTGVYNQSADFNGSTDYIEVENFNGPDQTFTISLWFNANAFGSAHVLADNFDNGVNEGWQLRATNSPGTNEVMFTQRDTSENSYNAITSMNLDTGKWYHAVGTYNGAETKVFLNGQRRDSVDGPSTRSISSLDVFSLGYRADANDRYFNGKIDDVRIYNTALTPQQVEKLYNLGAYRIPRRSTLQ